MPGINFPKFDTLNYGAAVQSGQTITENRIRNQMLGVAQQEQQNVIRNRDKAAQIRRSHEGTPAQIDALEDAGLFDQADKLKDSYLKQQDLLIKIIKGQRDGINKDNYYVWREQIIQSGYADYWMLPEEYSDDWFAKEETAAQMKFDKYSVRSGDRVQDFVTKGGKIVFRGKDYAADDDKKGTQNIVLSNTYFDKKLNKTMVQDIVILNGEEQPSGEPYPAGSGRGGKPWTMTNPQLNGIKRSIAEVFKGNYDSITGKFQLPDDRQLEEKQIAAIVRHAAELYEAKKGMMNMHEAAMQAIEKAGLPIPPADLTDPQGIREKEEAAAAAASSNMSEESPNFPGVS